jgi:hypothetical protein
MDGDRLWELVHAARDYIRRGFAPVPIYAGQKDPCLKNWLRLRLRYGDVPHAFRAAGNLGLILGPASRDLVDVDLDCVEARELADNFLPPTAAITGRPSSPRSHRWYICPEVQTVRHRDPVTRASIVELRGTGSQTLVGPSIHPSGERYDPLNGDPAPVKLQELRDAVSRLAAEVIRLRHGNIPNPRIALGSLPRPPMVFSGDRGRLIRRASAYLGAMPPAISGQGGHNAAYAAATVLVHGFCLTAEEAFEILRREYNPRCQPPWSEKELLHKVTDATTRSHSLEQGWLVSQR